MEYTGFDFDYDSQMNAISALLYRLAEADDNLDVDIESAKEFALRPSLTI